MIRRQPRILAAAALLLLALTAGCATPTVGEEVGAGVSPGGGGSSGASQQDSQALPKGFSYVSDVVPDVIQEIRYFSTYNFVGERIDGYDSPVAVLSTPAAEALQQASDDLRGQGYVLKVFDAYRPQRAVDHFVRWASDPGDERMKQAFYPDVDTSLLFPDGYIAERSGHSRGSTIDLSIVEASTGREVWMGTPFDFFGPASHHGAGEVEGITAEEAANRLVLRDAMVRAGFKPYAEEWWHYTLADEPYPETYFDFPVA